MKVNLSSLGCRLNEAELETWAQQLNKAGHQITTDHLEADLVILNSCAVTAEAVKKSRKKCRRLKRENPQAKLVVSGCYATLNADELSTQLGVDLVVPNGQKDQLIQQIFQQLEFKEQAQAIDNPIQPLKRSRQRAFIKIQDGCRYRCSYCIVTIARGEEKSRTPQQIIAEINLLVAQGIQEAVLTGVHLGGYGSDLNIRLSDLIQTIFEKTTLKRLRIGSIEPWEMDNAFWACFQNPRLMPHLHLPLQSGADSVLKRMSRRCRTADFYQLIQQARQTVSNISITTDIIVGFPNESESEWQQSFDFIEKCQFSDIHIFAYSAREGTKAATLANPISREIKKQRSELLHQLNSKLKQTFLTQQIGKNITVLIEQQNEKGYWQGYTPNYSPIEIDNPKLTKNQLINIEIRALNQTKNGLIGFN